MIASQFFAGQGVKHLQSGAFGVIHEVDLTNKLAKVRFAGDLKSVYNFDDLGPAVMDADELTELQEKIEAYPEQRGSRTFVSVDSLETLNLHAEYKVFTDTIRTKTPPRKDMKIETALDNGLVVTGGKCAHGVYITSREQFEDGARYCSVCTPYVIMAKTGIEYKG